MDKLKEEQRKKAIKDVAINLTAGAGAAVFTGLTTGPMTNINDIYTHNTRYPGKSQRDIFRAILEEGAAKARAAGTNETVGKIKELYRGQGSKILKNIPQNAINLALFTAFARHLGNRLNNDSK